MFAVRRFAVQVATRLAVTTPRAVVASSIAVPSFGAQSVKSLSSKVGMSRTNSSPKSASLPEVLATELVDAEADVQVDQDHKDVVKEIGKLFTIHDKPLDSIIKLSRKYKGEEITVEFHCQNEDEAFDMNNFENNEEGADEQNEDEQGDMPGMVSVDMNKWI